MIWLGKGELDLALIAIEPNSGQPAMEPKLRFRIAKISRMKEHRVRGIGFPDGSRTDGMRQLMTPSGGLVDERHTTLTWSINLGYCPQAPDIDWPGFSGAGVLLAETR